MNGSRGYFPKAAAPIADRFISLFRREPDARSSAAPHRAGPLRCRSSSRSSRSRRHRGAKRRANAAAETSPEFSQKYRERKITDGCDVAVSGRVGFRNKQGRENGHQMSRSVSRLAFWRLCLTLAFDSLGKAAGRRRDAAFFPGQVDGKGIRGALKGRGAGRWHGRGCSAADASQLTSPDSPCPAVPRCGRYYYGSGRKKATCPAAPHGGCGMCPRDVPTGCSHGVSPSGGWFHL